MAGITSPATFSDAAESELLLVSASETSEAEEHDAPLSRRRMCKKRFGCCAMAATLLGVVFFAAPSTRSRDTSGSPVATGGSTVDMFLRTRATTSTTTSTTTVHRGQCNPEKQWSGAIHPNRIQIKDPWWRDHCQFVNKGGHWQAPAGVQPRNYCWASIKSFAQKSAWKSKDITPENYWWAQMHASKKGQAPNPQQEILYPLHHPEVCDVPEKGGNFGEVISEAERIDDAEWLNRTVDIFVLNLDKAWQRMQGIAWRLSQMGIQFKRISGLDLSANGALQKAQSDGLIPSSWSYAKAKENLWKMYGESNKPSIFDEVAGIGTVGCAAAHLNAMKEAEVIAKFDRKPLVLILEDDVWLHDDFAVKLRRMLSSEAPCDWEALSLKSYNPVGECISDHLTRVWPDGDEPAEVCHRAANWGFQSMLYRVDRLGFVREHLQRLVWDVERPTCLVQDIALATISDIVKFYAVPASQWPGFLTFMKDDGWREQLNR